MIQYKMRLQIIIILLTPLFYLGIGGKYPWLLLGSHGIGIGMLFFAVSALIVCLAIRYLALENYFYPQIATISKLNLVIALIFALGYDFIQYKHFHQFAYQNPYLCYLAIISLIPFVVLIPNSKLEERSFFMWIGLFVIVHQLLSIYYFPLVIERSDMLKAIELSLTNYFSGGDPYHKTLANVGIPPYLPLTLLSFAPALWLKCDLRIITVIGNLILFSLIYAKYHKLTQLSKLSLILVLCNPYWLMRHDLYFYLFLIELCLIFIYLPHLNTVIKCIILACLISTLQFGWILFPFILCAISHSLRQLIYQALLSISIALIIVLSFIHHGNFTSFIHAIFLHAEYTQSYNSDITFGLSPIFYFASNQKLLYFSQIIGYLVILANILWHFSKREKSSPEFYLASASVAYFWFMLTNYFIETYLLIPLIFTISLMETRQVNGQDKANI
ncbi:MAG: hypothetical protein RLZZ293_475 [Pseudomonadota bacterium]